MMRHADRREVLLVLVGILVLGMLLEGESPVHGQESQPATEAKALVGTVQYQDLRRVGQATVQVRNQEGSVVSDAVSNDAGEFSIKLPSEGTYSLSAVQGNLRSEYVIVKAEDPRATPISLTLAPASELAIEVVSTLPPLQYRASSETYSLSRKEIEVLPRGNNIDLNELLYTIPSAAQSALKQVHIRQDHANLQLRIDGVPIPDTVTSTFSDVVTPRAWE